MSNILLMNAGSSSVKWKLFELETEKVVAKGLVERMLMPGSKFEIKYGEQKFQETYDNLTYERACELIIEKIQEKGITSLEEIIEMSDHAPLHNPMEAKYIELMQQVMPDTPQYAVFDSTFFTDMPEMNAIFSLPYELTQKYGIRRYGEHGISHGYISHRCAELLEKPLEDLKLITLHLGSGSSISAVKDGKAYDSSMGFTPLTGVTMGTRCGDVDPSIVPFLMKKLDKSAEEILQLFNSESGLLGISGKSPDMRDIRANIDDSRCALAREIFINRIVKYVGSYYVEMGGADVLVFAGGIGENDPSLRRDVVSELACLGISLDEALNEKNAEGLISTKDSKAKVMIVPTNEELAMVQAIKEKL